MNADPFPTFRPFCRRVRRGACVMGKGACGILGWLRRFFFCRRALIVYIILIILGCLGVTIDGWMGRRAWAAELEQLKADGDKFDIQHLLTSRPPDAENFFAIPELAGLEDMEAAREAGGIARELWLRSREVVTFDARGNRHRGTLYFKGEEFTASLEEYSRFLRQAGMLPAEPLEPLPTKELLRGMQEKWQPYLDALYAAASRPVALFLPTLKERLAASEDGTAWSGQALVAGRIMPALALLGRAAAATGDGLQAEKDCRILTIFEEAFHHAGGRFGFKSAASARRALLEVLREGVQSHVWTVAQLDAFVAGSDPDALFPVWRIALTTQRYISSQFYLDAARNGIDTDYEDWWRHQKITDRIGDFYLRNFPEGVALRACAFSSRDISQCLSLLPATAPPEGWAPALKKLVDARFAKHSYTGWDFSDLLNYWNYRRFIIIVCALERHYLAHGRYPAALSGLTPPLPAGLLSDTDEQPLRYGTAAHGAGFCLWSIGKDGKAGSSERPGDDLVVLTE